MTTTYEEYTSSWGRYSPLMGKCPPIACTFLMANYPYPWTVTTTMEKHLICHCHQHQLTPFFSHHKTLFNKRAQRQYGKQRQTTTYETGDKVSVAVPALDRISIDDQRIFGRVIDVIEEYDSYRIIKHGLLDRNYPIPEPNPLPRHINLGISNPLPANHIILHYHAA